MEGLAPMRDQSTPTTTEDTTEIPYGYCHCGCGQPTNLAKKSDSRFGWVRGRPVRFIPGHQFKSHLRIPSPTDVTFDVGAEGAVRVPLHSRKYPDLYTLVDKEDADLVRRYRWFANPSGRNGDLYVRGRIYDDGGKYVSLHRLLMQPSQREEVDHINGNTLDNRRSNLRVCTPSQNRQNQRRRDDTISGFKGVALCRVTGRWKAQIKVDGRSFHLGMFKQARDAARAYDEAARERFGEFARLNFPDERDASKQR